MDSNLLSKCSTKLLAEALVFHLQRLRARQCAPKPMGAVLKIAEDDMDKHMFTVLADAVIRDFHAARHSVHLWLDDLMQFTPTAPDLDARMVRTIVEHLHNRKTKHVELDPTIIKDAASTGTSSREYEIVWDEDEVSINEK